MGTNFWDSATEGFNSGVPLGVRAYERGEENKYRDREEARRDRAEGRQKESHGLSMRLGQKTEEATDLELEKKKREAKTDKIVTGIGAAIGMANVGKDRAAFKMGQEVYNNLVGNGDEAIVFHRDDKEDLKLPDGKTWKDFPEGTKHLVVTKQFGTMPYKNAKDFTKELQPYAEKPDKIIEHENERKTKAETFNMEASVKPFKGKDGKLYIKQMEMTNTGYKLKDVPYEGTEPMSAEEQKVRAIKEIPKELLNEEGKKILLGVKEKEKQPEPNGGTKSTKEGLEISGKQRDQFKKDLDLVLKPFAVGGKPVLDFETGVMTQTGENALKSAGALVDKAAANKDSLTPEEKRNLPHAKRALQMYEKISGAVSADYVKPGAGEDDQQAAKAIKELERRGYKKNEKTGQWEKPASGYGNRSDGTPKGKGFLGELRRPDGKVSTELSIGVRLDGKETEVPALVPTLSKEEVNYLLKGGKPTKAIIQKAVDHAKKRIAAGKSPFAEEDEY